ncbi:hypothetical protein BKI52_00300 [marine bacterium AO1-C]|nr:hypothetical protein BKI52_00300 [marine bacterium AO1-C]
MKLRITHNSIRIRIRKSELKQLAQELLVEETVNLGQQVIFKFALGIDNTLSQINASLSDNYLRLLLPLETAQTWINSNEVSLEVNQVISDADTLHLLIEKDFPCIDRPEEDKSDTFWELVPETPDAC